ncbi:alpha/beta-hydrolase [Punctularia strigosozonata HHB-11173 SS5]|uniref:alpha/beta-hydrolase n=1 Tax=Punctularia strigosozonata (strain HHB-11173) TaxID=741275 RepID=UPI00044167E4|nr:alpha/beta-hydrolase [Punctularia strigosozonata HHB-11173 SS5]EIN12936.1 alpha/beta-hydrolase [Punctularia strigosozonata HHB-11173 SS5]
MFSVKFLGLQVLLSAAVALAAPASVPSSLKERAVKTLSPSKLNAFIPYTQFASAAYCSSSSVKTWDCGPACDALPGFEVSLTGGDGDDVQLYYVGYWPSEDAVVLGHQGTDPTKLLSVATDINVIQGSLDSSLFPDLPSGILVHSGFRDAQASTASTVLAQVKSLLSKNSASKVIVVGHSLGGAIAELDSLMLRLNLPSSVSVKAVTFGTPRVGNPAFASFFDKTVDDFTRIDHAQDPVPIVPGRGLGYSHPSGEIHILSSGTAVSCPGEDDATDSQCTIESVPNILVGNIVDHLGPYIDDIWMGTALGQCL